VIDAEEDAIRGPLPARVTLSRRVLDDLERVAVGILE
jgi:hypothetical protein